MGQLLINRTFLCVLSLYDVAILAVVPVLQSLLAPNVTVATRAWAVTISAFPSCTIQITRSTFQAFLQLTIVLLLTGRGKEKDCILHIVSQSWYRVKCSVATRHIPDTPLSKLTLQNYPPCIKVDLTLSTSELMLWRCWLRYFGILNGEREAAVPNWVNVTQANTKRD